MKIDLLVKAGTSSSIYSVSSDKAVIGSDASCEVRLEIEGIASKHAMLKRQGKHWILEDLGGGVKVNGQKASLEELESTDVFELGPATITLFQEHESLEVRHSKSGADWTECTLSGTGKSESNQPNFVERFHLLLQLAQTIGSKVKYAEVLDKLMDSICRALHPERAVLVRLGPSGQLHFEAARQPLGKDPWRNLHISGTIVERVIHSGQAYIVGDTASAAPPDQIHSIASKGIRSVMCAPFYEHGAVAGAIYVDRCEAFVFQGPSSRAQDLPHAAEYKPRDEAAAASAQQEKLNQPYHFTKALFDEADLDTLILLSHLGSVAVQNVLDYQSICEENRKLRDVAEGMHELVGTSPSIDNVRRTIAKVAPADLPVLILGERGTGKELVARAIHRLSGRKSFVAVNCAAIPDSLMESTFFGHEKGAFTGAEKQQRGAFEQAHEGTLFLDEIGDLKLTAQAAILRALQEKEIQRIGSTSTVSVDVRLIAATNRDLTSAIERGEFRGDLFDRLNVLQIQVPPLSDHLEDIPQLAAHFGNTKVRRISAKALQQLKSYSWPGNIRELRNVIERAVVMGDGETIWPEDLPPQIRACDAERSHLETLEALERNHIIRVLRAVQGNVSQAAKILGIRRITIYKKLKAYGLDPEEFKKSW